MRAWMAPKEADNVRIISDDADAYEGQDISALVTLADTSEDLFTGWVQNHLTRLYHRLVGKYFHVNKTLSPGIPYWNPRPEATDT